MGLRKSALNRDPFLAMGFKLMHSRGQLPPGAFTSIQPQRIQAQRHMHRFTSRANHEHRQSHSETIQKLKEERHLEIRARLSIMDRYKELRRARKLPCQILWRMITDNLTTELSRTSTPSFTPSDNFMHTCEQLSEQVSAKSHQVGPTSVIIAPGKELIVAQDGICATKALVVVQRSKYELLVVQSKPQKKKEKKQDTSCEMGDGNINEDTASPKPSTKQQESRAVVKTTEIPGCVEEDEILGKESVLETSVEERKIAATPASAQNDEAGIAPHQSSGDQKTHTMSDMAKVSRPAVMNKERDAADVGTGSDMHLSSLLTHIPRTSRNMTQLENVKVLSFTSMKHVDARTPPQHTDSVEKATLGTKKFITLVLDPRGIHLDTGSTSSVKKTPFRHFGSVPPPPGCDVGRFYTSQNKELCSSTIWITPTDHVVQRICENYSEMQQSVPRVLNETEWADDAVKLLLKRERRMITTTLSKHRGKSRPWLPMRMREESFKPSNDSGPWETPPIIHFDLPADSGWAFNVQPDCSYWLWVGGFGAVTIIEELASLTSVRYRRALCPYLTVEIKKDYKPTSVTKGRQQVIVSASLALFNRYRLWEKAHKGALSQQQDNYTDLRHYGLLLAGVLYEFWCIRPHPFKSKWGGCTMRMIASGKLDNDTGVRNFINWINEIHRWGNTVHSNGCVQDVANARRMPKI